MNQKYEGELRAKPMQADDVSKIINCRKVTLQQCKSASGFNNINRDFCIMRKSSQGVVEVPRNQHILYALHVNNGLDKSN